MNNSIFKEVLDYIESNDEQALKKSLDNVHHDGLFSLVVNGEEPGRLTRIFIATKKIEPFAIQLHSHRYDLKIGVIKGTVLHHHAMECGHGARGTGVVIMDKFEYFSGLNSEVKFVYQDTVPFALVEQHIPKYSELYLEHLNIHSISASEGSMWIVQEQGYRTDSNTLLGLSFDVEGLYTEVSDDKIEEMKQLVLTELKKLVEIQEKGRLGS